MEIKPRIDDNNELLCPHCGNNYLHHAEVEVFTRHEDADKTLLTTVGYFNTNTAWTDSEVLLNPSSRRGGIRIKFWCESCTHESYLTMAQHKGVTIMEWEE